jgi:uncharacterized BrkB/YihY/UPF0761 family membrane protein
MKPVVVILILTVAILVLFGAILLQKPKKTKEGFAYTSEEIGLGVGAGVGVLVLLIILAFFLLSYALPKKVIKANAPKGWPVPFNME